MDEKLAPRKPIFIPVAATFFIVLVILGIAYFKKNPVVPSKVAPTQTPVAINSFYETDTFAKIKSDDEFISLMSQRQNMAGSLPVVGGGRNEMMAVDFQKSISSAVPSAQVDRSSGTNVQVIGIDEPDMVKSDDASIYYSKQGSFRCFDRGVSSNMKMMPQFCAPANRISVVNALPADKMKVVSSIEKGGDILISDKTLVVFTNSEKGSLQLEGYSVNNPIAPRKIWELPFSERSQKVAARLYNGEIYLVTSTVPTLPRPCPMPLIEGKSVVKIQCTDIYYPSSRPDADVVYSVVKLNPATGAVSKQMSFIAQSGQSDIYMSQNALYLSYRIEGNSITILNQFIAENKGVFPAYIEDKMAKLQSYDLSLSTKEIEMNNLLSGFLAGMDGDNRLQKENQLKDSFKRFFNKYKRSFDYTGIVKIGSSDLKVLATGKVPGYTLNQFSYDEWKGDLRVATTIGGRNPFYMLGGNDLDNQVSDVYVLNGKLEVKGSVKDLGKTERIYSVRFMKDRGYVVTYRQTDPFYVLDLSNANAPVVRGELKIPGYSSYLHELDDHLVLGIGRESQVKLSLFDVTDPKAPTEVAHYELSNEYWSEAMDNHHAFLQDPKYKIFFLPGSRGGYVFSYEGNTLSLVKALESPVVKRGLYLNNTLYVAGDTGIASFKEGTWEKTGQVTFEEAKPVTPSPVPVVEPLIIPESGTATAPSAPVK